MGIENLKEETAPTVAEDLARSLQELGIDPSFVVSPEHRPSGQSQLESPIEERGGSNIPIIDLAALGGSSQAGKDKIVEEIRSASQEWGFFQVINHGVSLELLSDVEKEARDFFALPLEEKRKIRRSSVNPVGYYESELTKNTRDWKEVFDYVVKRKDDFPSEFNLFFENQWPEGREKFRDSCEKWIKAVDELSFKVLELLALSLGVDPRYFFEFFGRDNTSIMRLNFYAKCPVPDLVLGVSRHKDQGALTVLVQDEVGGLEVRRKDGEWIRVTPRKDAFVINVGDLMQVWSNDLYHSVEHRVVVNENRDRFSSPYFMFPSYKSDIAPIESLTDPIKNPPKYAKFNWGEFDKNRKDSNFKRLGVENLQIYHYAINN
ncbi:2-oxoacid-dependent dioxygenase [Selaginella moellendorffii]|uniref:2-oxoacid-dependent dioxygenase n=1 Tax=Selaginella moellendorffii TaxID=88036 RepID=D8R2Y6_SELML|nr:probable 2-oxoglutarate-dependent dioxygenase ANS [Selaginella moellendorffii]EFJ32850.1 2-oxoacid-dependent dioxygenase [Selaginella moellendorffii]|eukprot:XP_002965430.1 probable 2-oxoglutarate-dependent dioxygenase ANS [Selaginella moellendorffii]